MNELPSKPVSKDQLHAIQSNSLSQAEQAGIRHGYYTRLGGTSSGIYGTLNTGLGSNDAREKVMANRAIIAEDLGVQPERLAGCYQIHSADVVTVTAATAAERPKADGMVTNVRGMGLGILTADCGPILFADANEQIIGACHAGWQGALTGIAENTIIAMEKLGSKRDNIVACLGPCISQKNYQVGAEFYARFMAHDQQYAAHFKPSSKPKHHQFDLHGFILKRLELAGVQASITGQCTYADEERFFSYRRTTHRAEPDYGRQMSAIALI